MSLATGSTAALTTPHRHERPFLLRASFRGKARLQVRTRIFPSSRVRNAPECGPGTGRKRGAGAGKQISSLSDRHLGRTRPYSCI
ncbi:MAG: hypothetical protein KME26_19310 [Oscillatoria princeps RMCB-10]|nr:hypothetical protein [Oscillatoria princeps RMCB-10]